MPVQGETDGERRRRRRALIRAHHPDTGGDAAEFIKRLEDFDHECAASQRYPEMRFARRRPWWQAALSSLAVLRRARRPKRTI